VRRPSRHAPRLGGSNEPLTFSTARRRARRARRPRPHRSRWPLATARAGMTAATAASSTPSSPRTLCCGSAPTSHTSCARSRSPACPSASRSRGSTSGRPPATSTRLGSNKVVYRLDPRTAMPFRRARPSTECPRSSTATTPGSTRPSVHSYLCRSAQTAGKSPSLRVLRDPARAGPGTARDTEDGHDRLLGPQGRRHVERRAKPLRQIGAARAIISDGAEGVGIAQGLAFGAMKPCWAVGAR
jgi:hypothetical protein